MKTKLSLLTLFACATAGTALLADNENYDGQDLSGHDFSNGSYVNSSWKGTTLTKANFSDANLTNTVFHGAILREANFSGANLTNVNFADSEIVGTDFTDAIISGANFGSSDEFFSGWSNALTQKQISSTKSYKEKNLKGISFRNANTTNGWTGIDFSGQNLTDADFGNAFVAIREEDKIENGYYAYDYLFSDAIITNTNFVGSTISMTQIKSTWNYKQRDFTNVKLGGVISFSVDEYGSETFFDGYDVRDISGLDLSGFVITGADFSNTNLSSEQLYSTKSYADDYNLSGVNFSDNNLSGWDFSLRNLENVNFERANLTNANLTGWSSGDSLCGANFTKANLTNADLSYRNICNCKFIDVIGLTRSQLASTRSFSDRDFSGIEFRGNYDNPDIYLKGLNLSRMNLSGTIFQFVDLTDADFTDAVISNASFVGEVSLYEELVASVNLTDRQLYSTASYKEKNLSGCKFLFLNLKGWDFSGQSLRNCSFSASYCGNCDFSGADLTNVSFTLGVDFSGANFQNTIIDTTFFLYKEWNFGGSAEGWGNAGIDFRGVNLGNFERNALKNMIGVDGVIENFTMTSSDGNLLIREYVPAMEGGGVISAKLTESATISGGAVLTLDENAILEIQEDTTLTLGDSGKISFGENAELHFAVSGASVSSVVVSDGGSVELSDTAKLVIDFTGTWSDTTTFSVMTWSDSSSITGLDSLTKGGNLLLYVNDTSYDSALWDFSTENNALTVYAVKPEESTTIIIKELEQIVNLKTEEYVGIFDESLTDYQGSISGSGNVYSEYTVNFGADASAHTGTIYVNGGKFTIVDAAKLGSSDFVVAKNAILKISGTRNFSNKLSGAGSFATSGQITLSGDASGHTGTTKVESGTLTIAQSAKLGTGAFDIVGTLALVGDRTFSNATDGTGVLDVASGAITFTQNIGTAKFDISENAEAKFAGTSDGYSGKLTGAGTLTTTQNFALSGDMSGFSGKTSVTAGTFTVSESAKLGTGTFDIAGTLALVVDRTFSNATNGGGKLEVSSGSTTFTTDVGVKTLAVSQDATATLNSGVDLTHANAAAQIAGTLNLLGSRTFSAATSGNGKITLASGSNVAFAKTVGVKTLAVERGAALRGNVSLTHNNAELSLAGELVLNADNGEKVSLGGGNAILASGASLDLIGNGTTTRSVSSEISKLASGEEVSIFENGAVSGDVVSFLKSDDDLAAFATEFAVIYDVSYGLSVQVMQTGTLDTSKVEMPSGWRDAFDTLVSDLGFISTPGFYEQSALAEIRADDPLVQAILTNPEKARELAMNILPGHYAAMVSMKTEAFNSDVRSISARLEQRRYERFSEKTKTEFFAQMQSNYTENEDDNDSPTYDMNSVSFLMGASHRLNASTTVGVAAGADFGDAKIHNGGGKLEMSDMRLTAFLGKTIENQFYINAGVQVGNAGFDIKRKSVWGDPKGEATAWNAGAFFDAGILLPVNKNLAAMPYVGMAYTHTWVEHFREKGAGALWDVDTINGDSLRGRAGVEFSWSFNLSGAIWRLGLDVAFTHDFLGEEVDIDARDFSGEKLPTITAQALPNDMFSIGPTVDVGISQNASIYGGYTFNAGTDSSTNHSANLGFRMRF